MGGEVEVEEENNRQVGSINIQHTFYYLCEYYNLRFWVGSEQFSENEASESACILLSVEVGAAYLQNENYNIQTKV